VPEEKPSPSPTPSTLDVLTKLVTFVSLAIASFAAWKSLPIDADIKRLQAETQRLDLALRQADAELKNLESNRRVTLELYQEVKKVIEKKEKDSREEEALRVLVESLADDPFRWRLLRVLAVGAASPEVKETAAATSKFYEEEQRPRHGLQPRPRQPRLRERGVRFVQYRRLLLRREAGDVRTGRALGTGSESRWRYGAVARSLAAREHQPAARLWSDDERDPLHAPGRTTRRRGTLESAGSPGDCLAASRNVVPDTRIRQRVHLPMTRDAPGHRQPPAPRWWGVGRTQNMTTIPPDEPPNRGLTTFWYFEPNE